MTGVQTCALPILNYADSQAKGGCDYIANVIGSENGFALVEMRGRFKVGDTLEVLSPTDNFLKTFTVEKAYLINGEEVQDCKLVQQRYKISCPYNLKNGDILRRRK